jgi:hypothetical protein
MDLKQRLDIIKTNEVALEYPQGGFGGMTNRVGKKPIIIACNGHAHGILLPYTSHLNSCAEMCMQVADSKSCLTQT